MQADPAMTGYISEGKIKISPGDALVAADVQRAWDTAKSDGGVDLVFYGIGEYSAIVSRLEQILNEVRCRWRAFILSNPGICCDSGRPYRARDVGLALRDRIVHYTLYAP